MEVNIWLAYKSIYYFHLNKVIFHVLSRQLFILTTFRITPSSSLSLHTDGNGERQPGNDTVVGT